MYYDLKTIGAWCRQRRIAAGVSQAQIARDLSYCSENISAFERGKNSNMLILIYYIRSFAPDSKIIDVIGGDPE